MKGKELRAEVLRLYHTEAWPIGTIARNLGVHHDTVARVLAKEGLPSIRAERAKLIDPFLPFIRETLAEYPRLQAQRLYDMCVERGYPGGPDHFRHLVRSLRPKPRREPFARRATLPGEEVQMDWAHFGRITVGRARRQFVAFVMVLSWSRMIFLRFFLGTPMECFLRGHVSAFDFYQAIPKLVLYDNLKSAVAERQGSAVRFHPALLDLSVHYRFKPVAAEVRRPTDKGKVERAIRYVRGNFFAGRKWTDLDDLNAQALEWCGGKAADRRRARDDARTVGEAFEEERSHMTQLPADAFPTEWIIEASVGKTPYVRFDCNDYTVPHGLVHDSVTVSASERRVRILKAGEVVADHERTWGKGEVVEDPQHLEALGDLKQKLRRERVRDRLIRSAPSLEEAFHEIARRGASMGAVSKAFLRLLDEHGATRLEEAVREALGRETPEPQSVKLILERRQHEAGLRPRMPVTLPDDPRVRKVAVRPATLEQYGSLRDDGGDHAEGEEGGDVSA